MSELLKLNSESLILIEADDFSEFRVQLLERKTRDVIYFSSMPDVEISDVLNRNKIKCLIFGENAISAIDAIRSVKNTNYMGAVRIYSGHHSAMEALAINRSDTHIIMIDKMNDDIFLLIDEIAKSLNIEVGRTHLETILSQLNIPIDSRSIFDESWRNYSSIVKRHPEFDYDHSDIEALDYTFAPIDKIREIGLRWAPRLFFAQNVENLADKPIELTGKARTLTFGPYMYLPKRRWRVTYHLNVVNNASGNTLIADVQGNLVLLAGGKMKLPKEGSIEFSLDFEVPAKDVTIEVRLHIIEGAIHGHIELVSVRFSRLKYNDEN